MIFNDNRAISLVDRVETKKIVTPSFVRVLTNEELNFCANDSETEQELEDQVYIEMHDRLQQTFFEQINLPSLQ